MTKSRPKRWRELCAKADKQVAELRSTLEELDELRQEYEDWNDNLPGLFSRFSVADKLGDILAIDSFSWFR